MIWLVSYPRSGNTFFRNVLFHCYGLNSKAFYLENKELNRIDPSIKATKTHHLLEDTPIGADDTVVYLIRDGRDAVVSMAYQMANITELGSDMHNNIYSILLKRDKSYFGGWSRHVREWKERADVIIRFESLMTNPLSEVEKLRTFVALPEPDRSQIPTFESQKSGKVKFHGKDPALFFHKGKVGGWKTTLSKAQLNLFYKRHGQELLSNGYENSTDWTSLNPFFELIYLNQRFSITRRLIKVFSLSRSNA